MKGSDRLKAALERRLCYRRSLTEELCRTGEAQGGNIGGERLPRIREKEARELATVDIECRGDAPDCHRLGKMLVDIGDDPVKLLSLLFLPCGGRLGGEVPRQEKIERREDRKKTTV